MEGVRNQIYISEKRYPVIQVIEKNCSAVFKEIYLELLLGNLLIELAQENKHLLKACREAVCLFFTSFPSCHFLLLNSSSFCLHVVTVNTAFTI